MTFKLYACFFFPPSGMSDFGIPEKIPNNYVHIERDHICSEEQPDIARFKIQESRFGQK